MRRSRPRRSRKSARYDGDAVRRSAFGRPTARRGAQPSARLASRDDADQHGKRNPREGAQCVWSGAPQVTRCCSPPLTPSTTVSLSRWRGVQEAQRAIAAIEDAMHLEREKAIADAEFYRVGGGAARAHASWREGGKLTDPGCGRVLHSGQPGSAGEQGAPDAGVFAVHAADCDGSWRWCRALARCGARGSPLKAAWSHACLRQANNTKVYFGESIPGVYVDRSPSTSSLGNQ